MAPFSFLQRGTLAEYARQFALSTYAPSLTLENLATGVDNLRHDVYLSPRFVDTARLHLLRLIAKHGGVEELATEDTPSPRSPAASGRYRLTTRVIDPAEFKRMLSDLHVVALNRAKADNNISIDLVARLAVIKFLRAEMQAQFANVLERCRARVRTLEGPRAPSSSKLLELRNRYGRFQTSKKMIFRSVGQDLFASFREIEKETLSRMRRSLFGEVSGSTYELFLNRLLFTEDGRDDYVNAEHYVMLGNYENDPDRFVTMRAIAADFLRSLGLAAQGDEDDTVVDSLLNAPENAQELVAGGSPEEATVRGKAQRALLNAWLELLERAQVMEHVVASYEVVPLLPEYSPPINAQHLKNALISKSDRARVETLLEEHARLSPTNLHSAVKRVAACRGPERAKLAGRFLADFMRYHRDLRRFEALNAAMDNVNVVSNEKLRELSSINNTLYDFLLPEEQRPVEDKVIHHVVLKADIRDSSALTRTLFERGLNPASYFSLNFYEPVNKLLSKYGATKVFIEGDAVILALLEREGEPAFGVARACVMAKEILEVVRGYNEASERSGLPSLELGMGVSYEDSAPLYLMDGASRIMISKALNESDRLSSCSRSARKMLAGVESLFNVYSFQTVPDEDAGGMPEEFLVRYNVGGINMNEQAFQKLRQEIKLERHVLSLPTIWKNEPVCLYSGLVPIGAGLFQKIAVREGLIPYVDPKDFSFKQWTTHRFYEVCVNSAVYEYLETHAAQAAGQSK
jgi:hypothetical protein